MTQWERPPAVAGRFYESDHHRLAQQVDEWLAQADGPIAPGLRGLVVPHAGYVYSGQIAGRGFGQVDPLTFRRVLLLGPAHFVPVSGIAASGADRWRTPLGAVRLDVSTIGESVHLGLAAADDAAHEPEHSLEVELPFLQRRLQGDWSLVPLLVGRAAPDEVVEVIDHFATPETLIVVSTDLSHYLPYDQARDLDAITARRIRELLPQEIADRDACGAHALRGALTWARLRGLSVHQLDLRSSGDTAGMRDRVVGYGSFALA